MERVVKNGMGIVGPVVEEEPFLELVVARTGVKLKSPLPPAEVCKLLQNIAVDILFNSFQKVEASRIQPV
jgi:hypothetical protein